MTTATIRTRTVVLNSSPRVRSVCVSLNFRCEKYSLIRSQQKQKKSLELNSRSNTGTPRRKPIPSTNIDNNRLQSTIPEAPGAVRLKIPSIMTPKKSKIEGSPSFLPKRFISRGDSEWIKDEDVKACMGCNEAFTMLLRKHHCRYCGRIYCM